MNIVDRPVMDCQDATIKVVRALDRITGTLRVRHRHRTVELLLTGRPSQAKLTEEERDALRAFGRTVAAVAAAGHGGIVDGQIEGYLSALEVDPGFDSHDVAA